MEPAEVSRSYIGKLRRRIYSGSAWALLAAASLFICVNSIINGINNDAYINPAGILFMFALAAASAYCALQDFSGRCPVKCPCCGKNIGIKKNAQKKKCEYCKNISVRNGEMLETRNR